MRIIRQTFLLGLTGLLLAACAPGAGFPPTPEPDQSTQTGTPVYPSPMPGTPCPAASPTPYPTPEAPLAPVQITPIQEAKVTDLPVIPALPDPGSQSLVDLAKEDLAQRLGIPVEEIDLVEFQAVTWPDGSLGCPQPGMGYIQILIDGLRIRLRAGGEIYHYHSGGNRPPFLCENPQEPYLPSGTVDK